MKIQVLCYRISRTQRSTGKIEHNTGLHDLRLALGRLQIRGGRVSPPLRLPKTFTLDPEEYERLLDAVFVVVKAPQNAVVENQTYEYWTKRVHGFFQLMRWSGLSIMDALMLLRSELFKRDGNYEIVTQRTKTGTDVSVVLPPDVAKELLGLPMITTPTSFGRVWVIGKASVGIRVSGSSSRASTRRASNVGVTCGATCCETLSRWRC
jgi:hypothetical protein